MNPLDPVQVSLLGAYTIKLEAYAIAQLVEKSGLGHGRIDGVFCGGIGGR